MIANITVMMRWGGDFWYQWRLPLSVMAYVNGCCSCHYIHLWKRSGNALSSHSIQLGLNVVLLLEISSACRSLLRHNEMFFLSPIMWKILITNTSALLVGHNKFYWTLGGNALYMCGTQISIVLIVSKAHSLQQKSYRFSFGAFCWVCIW